MQLTKEQKNLFLKTKNGNDKQVFLQQGIRFNLRQSHDTDKPTIIYCVLRQNGKKYMFNTAVKVMPSQWSRKRQQAIVSNEFSELENRNNTIANDRLKAIRQHYTDTIREIQNNPDKISNLITIFAEDLNIRSMARKKNREQAFTEQLNLININDIAEEKTKETREQSVAKWKSFIEEQGIADTADNLTYNNWEKFSSWLLMQKQKNGKNFAISSINLYQNYFKALIKRWNKQHPNTPINTQVLSNTKPHKQLTTEQKQSKYIILSSEQIEQAFSTHLQKQQQETAKNLFIFQCLIGCRTSDLKKIIKGEFKTKDINGLIYINYHSKKTNEEAFTPLLTETAKELFEWVKSLKSFPFKYDKEYNQAIKQAFKELGFTQETEYTEQRGTDIVTGHAPIYQLLHPHTGRHIFATLMYYKGVPLTQVKLMTGHKDTEILSAVYSKLDNNKELENLTKALQAKQPKQAENKPFTALLETIGATGHNSQIEAIREQIKLYQMGFYSSVDKSIIGKITDTAQHANCSMGKACEILLESLK